MLRGPVLGRLAFLLGLMVALAMAGRAFADAPVPIRVAAGPLGHTLQEIARQSESELLFDHRVVAGLQARRIEGRMTALAAVQAALAGANLTVRRVASGALIIDAPAAPPLAQQDAPVAEVLVIGHRTQNFDIRRQETDIQPYRVITGEQITAAHVDNLGEYFDERVPANTSIPTGGGYEQGNNSKIDLRGLGQDQTLVLIDGRRMPDFPGYQFGYVQPDINALPLRAIDRVETLTGTAGGIYGFGALGGVVNVVLAHDRPGAEAHLTSGLSSRGDAGRVAFEGRIEFSPDHGDTDVLLNLGVSHAQPLKVGQRDFALRDTLAFARVDPTDFIGSLPNGNSIGVFNLFGDEPLSFKPEYGGGALTASYTLLPTGFEGGPQALAAALASHAGQIDYSTSNAAAASDLTSTATMGSALMTVRHRFGGGIEAYFDAIALWNHTRYVAHGGNSVTFLFPDSPDDPFEQYLLISFPTPLTTERSETDFDSTRFTAGLLAPLTGDWRATAEVTWGGTSARQFATEQVIFGAPDDANPLGSWSAFQKAVAGGLESGSLQSDSETRYGEQSLRLAGPLFRLPGGPATLTLLAEHWRETAPGYLQTFTGVLGNGTSPIAAHSTATASLYAELRSRVFAEAAPSPWLRQLEVQLAVRAEREYDDFSAQITDPTSPRLHAEFPGVSYTFGAKVSPWSWLMLRASVATGETPPSQLDLDREDLTSSFPLDDPKRGGFLGTDDTPYVEKVGGSAALKSVHASTVSVGVVLTPFGADSLRLSLDYSRIKRSNDVLHLDVDTVLAHEDFWPQRVQRGPLTDADRALGYTAGPITLIDVTSMNGASREVRTLDMRLDWPIDLPVGQLRLYGAATYAFDIETRGLFQPDLQFAGANGAPLTWRANVGVDWTIGPTIFGANVRYYGSYGVEGPLTPGVVSGLATAYQGSDHIPPQAYLDLRLSRRLPLRGAPNGLKIDFGVSNVLDTAPPRVTAVAGGIGGISPYGDPRRRRFEVTLSALF
ncbi:TonB-dependent receptor plug domain-containing protein [Caulobacter sp. KR2-114]|uniref:TonB-dependent receptor plug domain-containing protein n=1 Tax=Caulobacter sp. KR2-114 TaxID=3400912 RepID=UPI003C063A53